MIAAYNLGNLFNRDLDPNKTAFIGIENNLSESHYSFNRLDEMADGVVQTLHMAGLQRGDRVAVLAANSARYVATLLGIMRGGFVAVPVNYKFPPALIAYVLADSGAKWIFCDHQRMHDVPAGLPFLVMDIAMDSLGPTLQDGGASIPFQPTPRFPAMILYTSGSTGKPKGVLLSHESHAWVVRTRIADGMQADQRILIAAPLYHMNALALTLLSLAAHSTTVLLPQFTAQAYIHAIERHRCTYLTSVPPMIAMILREEDLLNNADLSCVREIRMGSAPVSESLLQRIRVAFPQARITNAYGTTEGGPVVFGPHPMGIATPHLSVGHARPDVGIRLVDDAGNLSSTGMLQMKSPALMLGYHQRPDLVLPFTEDGYYNTGDVFHRDAQGFHYFVGRRDDMFVSGGENIFPSEVERMLEQHPAVQQACVVPVDDEIKGTKPVAFVVARHNASCEPLVLKQYALANAPAYQHPRHIWVLDALPLASTNKIDRKALMADAVRRLTSDTQAAD